MLLNLETRRTDDRPEKVIRTGTQRDHDRVLYSSSFRRLGGVTQTAMGPATAHIHNRLTHSLKVEHMGAALYQVLTLRNPDLEIDQDAIRAACLAHDLGHPPFGHIAEDELNHLLHCAEHQETSTTSSERTHRGEANHDRCGNCHLPDGFEGNAQSFRILTRLEAHKSNVGYGLNLTLLSLRATSKYPWLCGDNDAKPGKWGAFDCDAHILDEACPQGKKDIHADIMDWADDIAYAVHDLEDFFTAGLIPLQEHSFVSPTATRFARYVEPKRHPTEAALAAWEELREYFPKSSFIGSNSDLKKLDTLRSTLISQALDAVTVTDTGLVPDPLAKQVNGLLKELTWYHIIDNPDLTLVQQGQRGVIRRLYGRFYGQLVENKKSPTCYRKLEPAVRANGGKPTPAMNVFPARLRRYLGLAWGSKNMGDYETQHRTTRAIVDYIASLSDADAYRIDEILNGAAHQATLGSASFTRGG